MYVTKLNTQKVIEWFSSESTYDYMMLFVSSFDAKDKSIVKYILSERVRIDKITGNNICFFHFAENDILQIDMSNAVSDMMLWHINDYRDSLGENILDKNSLRYGCGIEATSEVADDICERFNILRYKLPALILISKDLQKCDVFPMKSTSDIEAFLTIVRVINQFLNDKEQLENRIKLISKERTLSELDLRIKNIKRELLILTSNQPRPAEKYWLEFKNVLLKNNVSEEICEQIRQRPSSYRKMLKTLSLYEDRELLNTGKKWCKMLKVGYSQAEKTERILSLQKKLAEYNEMYINGGKDSILSLIKEELEDMYNHYIDEFKVKLFINDGLYYLEAIANNKTVLPQIIKSNLKAISKKTQSILTVQEDLKYQIEQKKFDVFISCKSEDYSAGMELYELLSINGFTPFIADVSIREIGSDNYGDLIRKVIDICKHMIVFTTNVDYISTPYVHHEWNLFLDELTAGRKSGHLLTIIPDIKAVNMLPIGLRNKQCYDALSYKKNILNFLK